MVTKHPTNETVPEGGYCYFVAKYENARYATWHFVSPDGATDLDFKTAEQNFTTLEIEGGETSQLLLKTIPLTMNGWKVYCDFYNNLGHTKTNSATLTVTPLTGGASGVQAGLPVVTKNPTNETVDVGGSCYFVAKYEDAIWAVWHFVSPDGKRNLTYQEAQTEFPGLEILKGYASTMQLKSIPAALNGWWVYCEFRNNVGTKNTESALITVKGQSTAAANPGIYIQPSAAPAAIANRDYSGLYVEPVAQKATIEITGSPERYFVTADWSVTYAEKYHWTFSGQFSADGVLSYSDAVLTVLNLADDTSTVKYQNGTGTLSYSSGTAAGLYWTENTSEPSATNTFFAKN